MQPDVLHELVQDAVATALAAERGGDEIRLSRRMIEGKVVFEDGEGREVKTVDVFQFFRKVTAVREKLRVLEQKVNNHDKLDHADRAELQGYITRAYGSLTTFNFLFAEDDDRFKGTGG